MGSVFSRGFAPVVGGVYYFTGPVLGSQTLKLFSWESRTNGKLFDVPRLDPLGISMTPDEQCVFYGQADDYNDELMMVTNFWK